MPRLRIFMAEDSEAARARLAQDLGHAGDIDIVGCANTEISAVTWLVRHPHGWDLAIVDLASNPQGELRTLALCRVRRADQKVVVLRSNATPDVCRRCRGLGADLVLDKLADSASLLHYCAGLNADGRRPEPRGFLARLGLLLRRGLAALVQRGGIPSSN